MVTQNANGFKHITLLRKLILEKRSGTAWFDGEDWRGEIEFERGMISGEATRHISMVLSEPVFRMGWEKPHPSRRQPTLTMPVRNTVSKAIATMNMPVKRMIAYRKQFETLPNIKIRHMSLFRADHAYQKHFQELYQMSLVSNGASLSDYFAAAIEIAELRVRVNIALGAYCLGDLVAVPAPVPAAIADTEQLKGEDLARVSVVSRILTKLREGRSG